ncbi:uncharacterized protein LOC123551553 [Mercenaria mercenaria]|uniref:uncharacterized protein LOC123551553 n=1 Tax=Mercenaria mercenaria TaxID=6596 RepID=UPI00234E7BB5|nr:uncharacterized protein LOC123551553 [Mercenaria mercenaria]
MDSCKICHQQIEGQAKAVKLSQKGCDGINDACDKRNDSLHVQPGDYVHVECRKHYCNPNCIKRDTRESKVINDSPLSPLRSKNVKFSYKEHCLYCGQPVADVKGTKRKRGDVWPITTLEPTILNVCLKRNDSWSDTVKARIEQVSDLPAADAAYHQICSSNFRTGKNIPEEFQIQPASSKKRKPGRPEDEQAHDAFLEVMKYLKENDDEQVTIKQLQDKMVELCGDKAYSITYPKQKIIQHFGEAAIITEINGKANVTLRRTASSILHDFYRHENSENTESEKLKLIKTAAKLIKSDIKSKEVDKTLYPDSLSIEAREANKEFLPDSLYLLLRVLFNEKDADEKISAIGHAIMQGTRPRAIIAPLQFGLAVSAHHLTGSKYIVELLNSIGFCVSYTEVELFEKNAAISGNGDIEQDSDSDSPFIQYVADNVDHNLCTIDGHGTFHGMGMIVCVTPGKFGNKPVKRQVVSSDELLAAGKVEISYYRPPTADQRTPLQLEELVKWTPSDCTARLTLLAQITWPLRYQGPEWSGFMQMVRQGEYPGKSSVVFLPMTDMSPGDMSCIYTTLQYIGNHAKRYNQTAIVTFDQPLYWKAMTVVANENTYSLLKAILVRLGGFHCIMSFLGCIGQLMSGSGLSELLETIYAPNTIPHMMSGRAVSRAVRAHFLASNALNVLLMRQYFGTQYDAVTTHDETEKNHEEILTHEDSNMQQEEMMTHKDPEMTSEEIMTQEDTENSKEMMTQEVTEKSEEMMIIESTERSEEVMTHEYIVHGKM